MDMMINHDKPVVFRCFKVTLFSNKAIWGQGAHSLWCLTLVIFFDPSLLVYIPYSASVMLVADGQGPSNSYRKGPMYVSIYVQLCGRGSLNFLAIS